MGQFCWNINSIWKQLKIWRGGWLGHGEKEEVIFMIKTRRRPYFFNFQFEINNENQSHRPFKNAQVLILIYKQPSNQPRSKGVWGGNHAGFEYDVKKWWQR